MRAGLTGLGLVFVLVLLTAGNLRTVEPVPARLPQGETLAVIGVAPNSGVQSTPPGQMRQAAGPADARPAGPAAP